MKRFNTIAVLCSLLFLLTGCATVSYNHTPKVEIQSIPPIGEISVVSVGDRLIHQGSAITLDTIFVEKETELSNITVKIGSYKKVGEEDGFEYFQKLNAKMPGGFGGSSSIYDSITIRIKISDNSACFIGDNYLMCPKPAVEIPFSRSNFTEILPDFFQQTLLYNGKIGSKLRVGYREFGGGAARTAFSNEVEYDLKESNVIGYKGVKIEVIDANNEIIKYRVLSNFK